VLNVVNMVKEDLMLAQKRNQELESQLAHLCDEFREKMTKVKENFELIQQEYSIQQQQFGSAGVKGGAPSASVLSSSSRSPSARSQRNSRMKKP
jgi:hypothetical protein